jgi:subtilisin family serine protease
MHIYMHAIIGFSVLLTENEIRLMEYLFGNSLLPGMKNYTKSRQRESLIPTQSVKDSTQVVPTGISRIQATPKGNMGNVDVAVIDTGVDARHPDLNVVGGVNCIDKTGDQAALRDGVGHGTHVAGTIGARDNGMGVVGVAPGARIWSVKVLDDMGYGTWGSVLCGIDWVVAHADTIEVANMSLGGPGWETACYEDDPMHNAICFGSKRVIFVVAAGNETDTIQTHSPANYKEAVTVSALADFDGQPGGAGLAPDNRCSAMSVDDELASFSNYGEGVDIAAPGVCILSTLPGKPDKDGAYQPAYGYASGTSMATPHVTGAIARFLSENPDQRDEAVQQVLMWSASHEHVEKGDHDAYPEPVLYVGSGAPRYVPGKNAPPGS